MDTGDQPVSHRNPQDAPLKWKTPSSNYHESPKSSLRFSAQARNYEKKFKKVKVNPFEPEDPSVLGENTCSPGMLETAPEPDEFSWSIDDISRIQPAAIDSPHFSQDEYDEKRELIAQEAIKKYFSSTHSVLSPDDAYQGTWRSPACSTLSIPSSVKTISSTPKVKTRLSSKNDAGTQTIYSFPPVLPSELEEILKPYMLNISSVDTEEANILNTSTLRRKLLFHNDDDDTSFSRCNRSFTPSPLKTDDIRSRINWSGNLHRDGMGSAPSSPDLSPIRTREDHDMSLGTPEISTISNAEVSMLAMESPKRGEPEGMAISTDEHNRIFSSTVVAKGPQFESCAESGYGTCSYETSLKL